MDILEQRCFKQNVDPSLKEVYRKSWATYYPIYVTHKISLLIVRLLLQTSVTPNQITVLSCVSGIVAGLLFLKASFPPLAFIGALFFELYYIFDAVDGQLARARKVGSRGGGFFDEWGNFLIPPFVVCCIGLGVAPNTVFPWLALLAGYTVLSVPLIEVIADRWFTDRKGLSSRVSESITEAKLNLPKLVYSLLYRSCTMPVVMNLVTLSSLFMLLGFKFPILNFSLLGILVCYYAIVGTGVWITKVIKVAWSE